MGRFSIIEQTATGSNQVENTRINPDILSGLFEADRNIGAAASQTAQKVDDFTQNLHRARVNSEVNSSRTRIRESFDAVIKDFETRNDFTNFDKDFDQAAEKTLSMIADENLSNTAINQVSKDFDEMLRQAAILKDSVRNGKEIDSLVAGYRTNRESAVNEGNVALADELTNQAFTDNLIDADSKRQDLLDNSNRANFIAARNKLDLFPDDQESILKEFPVDDENTQRLKRYAAGVKAERVKAKRDRFFGFLRNSLSSGDFDLAETLDVINEASLDEDKWFSSEEAAVWSNLFNEAADQKTDRMLAEGSDFLDAYYTRIEAGKNFDLKRENERLVEAFQDGVYSADKAAEQLNRLEAIADRRTPEQFEQLNWTLRRDLNLKKITPRQAHHELLAMIEAYPVTADRSVIKDSLTMLQNIENELDSEFNAKRRIADRYIDKTFPKGFFGELAAGTVEQSEEKIKKLGERISREDNPEEVQRLRIEANQLQEDLNIFGNELNRKIDALIRARPDIGETELIEAIRQFSEQPLNDHAFRQQLNAGRKDGFFSLPTFKKAAGGIFRGGFRFPRPFSVIPGGVSRDDSEEGE